MAALLTPDHSFPANNPIDVTIVKSDSEHVLDLFLCDNGRSFAQDHLVRFVGDQWRVPKRRHSLMKSRWSRKNNQKPVPYSH